MIEKSPEERVDAFRETGLGGQRRVNSEGRRAGSGLLLMVQSESVLTCVGEISSSSQCCTRAAQSRFAIYESILPFFCLFQVGNYGCVWRSPPEQWTRASLHSIRVHTAVRHENCTSYFSTMSELPIEDSTRGIFALRGLDVNNENIKGEITAFDNPASETFCSADGGAVGTYWEIHSKSHFHRNMSCWRFSRFVPKT